MSEGEKDDNNDDASVTRREGDPSCLAAAVTSAWQSEDLSRERVCVRESRRQIRGDREGQKKGERKRDRFREA